MRLIFNNSLFFCCKGCQGVYHLLQDDGFDSFYDKKGKSKFKLSSSFKTSTSIFAFLS